MSQGPGFKTENGVTNVAIHELDICRWLLGDEYEDAQCVRVRQSANSNKGYDNPQVMLMRTRKGCFIDVEVQVADGYGYDIQCELVTPFSVLKPGPWDTLRWQALMSRGAPSSPESMTRFISA